MNCRRAQSDIALWVGDDLDEAGLRGLRRHLEVCSECRGYMQEMQLLMQLVDDCPLRETGDEASKRAVEDSLWPSLSTRLVSVPCSRTDRFNGWIPAVTVAVVCLAMVLIASPPQILSPQDGQAAASANEDTWSAPKEPSPAQALGSQPKWEQPPIQGRPAVNLLHRLPPVPELPIEMMLDSDSLPPCLREIDGPVDFYIDRSDPRNPRLYMRIPEHAFLGR